MLAGPWSFQRHLVAGGSAWFVAPSVLHTHKLDAFQNSAPLWQDFGNCIHPCTVQNKLLSRSQSHCFPERDLGVRKWIFRAIIQFTVLHNWNDLISLLKITPIYSLWKQNDLIKKEKPLISYDLIDFFLLFYKLDAGWCISPFVYYVLICSLDVNE